MRQPSAGTVVLVQLRTGRGDRLDDPFLACVQLDTATRQQPGPPPPEQANTVKTELNRRKTANPEQGRRDFSQIPTPQDRVGDVRHVSPVSMRPQARHSDALQTIPQRPHGTLRATVEQQAHRQRHPVTVIGRFAWKNSTRYTQSATGQPLVVDGADQALEIGLEAVGANLDRLTAGVHRDRRWKGVPGRHRGVKHEHRDDLDAVRDRGFSPEPDEVARVVDALAAALVGDAQPFRADDDRQGVARAHRWPR